VLFFDGGCGLCHRTVRLLLRLDRNRRLRFAPLGGEAFAALVPESERAAMPDSLVLHTTDGRLLLRSQAVAQALRIAGGAGAGLALFASALPRGLADRLYDALARRRHRLFERPAEACPVTPGPLRGLFLR
jgi:predicted DCC family thiol-disulfide oxidoreductase YuxK